MFGAFEDVMIKDLIPMIDATYRTLPDQPEEGQKDEQGTKINERQSNR